MKLEGQSFNAFTAKGCEWIEFDYKKFKETEEAVAKDKTTQQKL